MQYIDKKCLLSIMLLTIVAMASAQPPAVSDSIQVAPLPPAPIAQWAVDGRITRIDRQLKAGRWQAGSPEEMLARAITESDGEHAFGLLRRLTTQPSVSDSIQTIAWFHLYGYYRLKSDPAGQAEALDALRENLPLARTLFRGPLPPPPSTDPLDFLLHENEPEPSTDPYMGHDPRGVFSLQLGAFSTQDNARRFAASKQSLGVEVFVQPVNRGSSTLYTVLAGHFTTESQALQYGEKKIGTAGKDFSVVRK